MEAILIILAVVFAVAEIALNPASLYLIFLGYAKKQNVKDLKAKEQLKKKPESLNESATEDHIEGTEKGFVARQYWHTQK